MTHPGEREGEGGLPADRRRLSELFEAALEPDVPPGLEPPGDGDADFIGGYRIESKIGEGGMGTVYRALQVSLKRTVALKVLRDRLASDDGFIERFVREARVVATLSHPNIVGAVDVGRSGSKYYFVMEHVEGESAGALVRREGRLEERRATEIALQVARALEYARSKSLVHRDVKPDNILIDSSGTAKLADLGLARSVAPESDETSITHAGTLVGTPDYVSPEQALCERDLDSRTDVYSLGAALFHLVTGRPPFTGRSRAEVVSKHLNESPPMASEVVAGVSADVSLVILKAMAKDRGARYRTPGEMASDLEALLEGRPPTARSDYAGGVRRVLSGLARGRYALPSAAGLSGLVLLVLVGLYTGTPAGTTGPAGEPGADAAVAVRPRPALEDVAEAVAAPLPDVTVATPEPGPPSPRLEAGSQEDAPPAEHDTSEPAVVHGELDEEPDGGQEDPEKLEETGGVEAREADEGARAGSAGPSGSSTGDRAGQAFEVRARAGQGPSDAPALVEAARVVPPPPPEVVALPREVTNSIGMRFCLVPAGEFVMGSSEADEQAEDDERPARTVRLEDYYIGRCEVTVAEFGRFRPGHAARFGEYMSAPDLPVSCVSWEDAVAFCGWLSAEEAGPGREYRLPTEAQWEKAARSPAGGDGGGRVYPWGDDDPGGGGLYRANFAPGADRDGWALDGFALAAPVGKYAAFASPCGAVDMAGNVWEWCLDRYRAGYGENTEETGKRVLRGGAFSTGAASLRAANRAAHVPAFFDPTVGFRCVMTPGRRPGAGRERAER